MLTDIEKDLLVMVMRLGSASDVTALRDLIDRITVAEKREDRMMQLGENQETQLRITSQDRDNRRRRMELAMVLLDENQTLDLDSIAALIWPQPKSEHEIFMAGSVRGTQGSPSPHPIFAPRTFGAPTSVPGPNLLCPRNPAIPNQHQWGPGMEPECIFGCGVKLLMSQAIIPDSTATPTQTHTHRVQVSADGTLLSSYCVCGQRVADVYIPDPVSTPTSSKILNTGDHLKQPGSMCTSEYQGETCRFEAGHSGLHESVDQVRW